VTSSSLRKLSQQPPHGRAGVLLGAAPARPGVGLAGDLVQVGLLVLVQPQGTSEGGQDGRGRLDAALLQPRVVIHADRRDLGDLLTAQPVDLTADADLG
jgi:hypothetical protein